MNADFQASVERRYVEQCDRGVHDDECEWRAAGFWLCHCSKRRREAAGVTEPPVMIFESPTCSGCDRAAVHTGDGWACSRCRVYFGDRYDEPGNWEDDYGPDLAADLAKWEAQRADKSRAARDPRPEARPVASSSGDRAAADTHGGTAAAPQTTEEK